MSYELFDKTVLTERQKEVYEQYIRGQSTEDIADALGCSESTVTSHISDINKRVERAANTEKEGRLPTESPFTLVSDGVIEPITLAYIWSQIEEGCSVIILGEESRRVSSTLGMLLGERVVVSSDDVWFKSPERSVESIEEITDGVGSPIVRSMWYVDEPDYLALRENQAVLDVGDRGDVVSVLRSFRQATDATVPTALDDVVFVEMADGSITDVSKVSEVSMDRVEYDRQIVYDSEEGGVVLAPAVDRSDYQELVSLIEENAGSGYSAYWSVRE